MTLKRIDLLSLLYQLIFRWNTRQCNTVHYNTIQYNTVQYNTIQYNTIQYNTIQYNTIQYNTIQYNTIQYNTIQNNTIQYSTIQDNECSTKQNINTNTIRTHVRTYLLAAVPRHALSPVRSPSWSGENKGRLHVRMYISYRNNLWIKLDWPKLDWINSN